MLGTKRVTPILFVVLVLLSTFSPLGVTVRAEPKTIVVPDDYTDIQEAINHANPGDTVYVKKGTHYHEGAIYGERAFAYIINKSISLIGEDSQTTILKPQYTRNIRLRSCILVTADNVLISGFTIDGIAENTTENKLQRRFVGYEEMGIFVHTIDHVSRDPYGCKIIGNIFIGQASSSLRDNSKGALISENQFFYEQKTNPGISLTHAFDTIISNNSLYSARIDIGGSENVTIKNNQIIGGGFDNTTIHHYTTVSLGCDTMKIFENNITNCDVGLLFSGVTNCHLFNNTIANNRFGIILRNYIIFDDNYYWKKGSNVYHNNFVNNENHVFIDNTYPGDIAPSSGNRTDTVSWDYHKIGNYWDNYNGTDNNQDKIGDTPYVFDAKNQDNYPLMERFEYIEIKTDYSLWLVIMITALTIILTPVIYRKITEKPK